jgi:diguanylate cyclase (GGDEF)-like protein
MLATPLTSSFRRSVVVRNWAWWQLPLTLRCYVAVVPLAAAVAIGVEAAHTDWRVSDLAKFVVLMVCGVISMASTPKIAYTTPGVTRDFTTVWVLPTAVLLPPIYAALAAIPIFATLHLWVHRGVLHRTVFSGASISLSYTLASVVFRSIPSSFAGGSVGSGTHALTWAMIVALCYVIGSRVQRFLIFGAVKMSNPAVRIRQLELNREALQGLFVEVDLGALITLAVAVSPALVVIALPTVLLTRAFLVNPLLVAQSRVDSKTGLLNVSTWEREAEGELSRSIRMRHPIAMAIVDIDHFKRVNDTYGHLVGDRVLRAVADALKGQSRDYDKVGRFGGEEFVLLLAQADGDDACKIAERIRSHIGEMAVPIDDRPQAPCVQVTISIGVSAMERSDPRELTDLLAAADSALYKAKEDGRNRICLAAPVVAGQLVAEIADQMESVQADPAGTSLCPRRLLYASVTERYGVAIAPSRANVIAPPRVPMRVPHLAPQADLANRTDPRVMQ